MAACILIALCYELGISLPQERRGGDRRAIQALVQRKKKVVNCLWSKVDIKNTRTTGEAGTSD